MIYRFLIAIFSLMLFTMPSYANDRSIDGVGGQLFPMKGEHSSVSMLSEIVKMDIYEQYYDVKVEFIFQNKSANTVKVKMGFPEGGHGGITAADYKTKSAFTKFATFIDGSPVKAERVLMDYNEYAEFYKAYWVKDVTFKPWQKSKVTVNYTSKTGSIVFGIFAEYNFTGGNWKGKVEESKLIATLHTPAKYKFRPVELDDSLKPYVKQKNNQIIFIRKNWEAEASLNIILENSAQQNN